RRDDELVQVVENRARRQLSEQPGVTSVGSLQRPQVIVALTLVDDHGRVAEADEHQIEHETTGSAIPVEKRMDLVEATMKYRESLRKVRAPGFKIVDLAQPGRHFSAGQNPRGRSHSSWEQVDVVLPKVARAFSIGSVRMRGNVPDWGHRHAVDLAKLGHRENFA